MSLTAFAAREGLTRQRLHLWRRRLARDRVPQFREITAGPRPSPFFELRVADVLVRVSPDFDADALRRLLALLTEFAEAG